MRREKLTKAFIDRLTGENIKIQDAEISTLELWCGPRGKAFYFTKKHNFQKFRRVLGRYPEYTREMAVRQCHIYTANLAQYGSLDPLEDGKLKQDMTLLDAYNHYCNYKHPDANFSNCWNKNFRYLESRKLVDISKSEIKALHAQISETAPVSANRAIAYLKAVINLVINDELYEGGNPAAKITMNREEPRVKYLMPSEAPRVIDVLEDARKRARARDSADAMLLMLYQGQRKGNVLAMEWNEIDEENVWIIPKEKAKAKKDIVSPLVKESIDILNARKGNGSSYVFPAKDDPRRPVRDCKKLWKKVCALCGVSDMHIHDLRHTSATYQLREGADIATVSDNLGHADIGITKRVYAHVMTDTQRAALQNAADALKGRGG